MKVRFLLLFRVSFTFYMFSGYFIPFPVGISFCFVIIGRICYFVVVVGFWVFVVPGLVWVGICCAWLGLGGYLLFPSSS
jgi:hypothetical protein